MPANTIVKTYYVATALFLLLDAVFGINVRIAFLADSWPWRLAYYGICFTCLALMMWRPAWTAIVAGFESLVTLVALILSMGVRVMLPFDPESGMVAISIDDLINFMLAGSIAYLSYTKGVKALQQR